MLNEEEIAEWDGAPDKLIVRSEEDVAPGGSRYKGILVMKGVAITLSRLETLVGMLSAQGTLFRNEDHGLVTIFKNG